MKILKNAGSFKVLTKTEDVISNIANAARICYQSQDKASSENDIKLVRNLITRGHTACLEFADMTVQFNNCSRGFTHEMVRHRLASFAQESTRYVDEKDFEIIVPPHKDEESYDGGIFSFKECLSNIEGFYKDFRRRGWKPEDARQILPTGLHSQIVVKANMTEWRHIFYRRCDHFAHWEIRAVMLDLLRYCKENIPIIFDDFHFFRNDNSNEYARKIMSEHNLKEEIIHRIKSGLDVSFLKELIND